MKSNKNFKKKYINKHTALRLLKGFNGINSFSRSIMTGGSGNNDPYRDENHKLKILEDCVDCRDDMGGFV